MDRARIYVGSFNFDPRSARLNTEIGVVLESAALASRLSGAFDTQILHAAYEVRLTADGRGIEWIERTERGEVRHGALGGHRLGPVAVPQVVEVVHHVEVEVGLR